LEEVYSLIANTKNYVKGKQRYLAMGRAVIFSFMQVR